MVRVLFWVSAKLHLEYTREKLEGKNLNAKTKLYLDREKSSEEKLQDKTLSLDPKTYSTSISVEP